MSNKAMSKYLKKDNIKFIEAEDKKSAIKELWNLIKDDKNVKDSDKLLKELLEREKIMSTGIGAGIAVPHIKSEIIKDFVFAIGISKKGIDFDSIDKKKVHIIVMVAAPAHKHQEYLKLLAKIVLKLKNKEFRNSIINAKDIDEIYNLFTK